MIYLKLANLEDAKAEYEALQKIPAAENGWIMNMPICLKLSLWSRLCQKWLLILGEKTCRKVMCRFRFISCGMTIRLLTYSIFGTIFVIVWKSMVGILAMLPLNNIVVKAMLVKAWSYCLTKCAIKSPKTSFGWMHVKTTLLHKRWC